MPIVNTYTVSLENSDIRLLDFVIQHIKEYTTRNGAKKAIKSRAITVNGNNATTGTFLKMNDVVEINELTESVVRVFELKLDVLYEDEYLAVIYKPAGYGVSGNYFMTIQNAIPFNFKKGLLSDSLNIPRPIHRLDNPTSGLLIIAKTTQTNIMLGSMLANKEIKKLYTALVAGEVSGAGTIISPIEIKEAHSTFEFLKLIDNRNIGKLSLVKLSPITGRTHQLRIHMASIGHPIIGDKIYGNVETNRLGKGLFLCANHIEFNHPITNELLIIESELPNKFRKLIGD